MSAFLNPPVNVGVSGVKERCVSFQSNGRLLQGTLAFPAKNQSVKRYAITLHGWGGERCGPHRILLQIGRKLAAAGIPCLRFDLSGRGLSEGGDDISLDDMIQDTLSAMWFLSAETGCSEAVLCGLCSGGNVAIGAATLTDVRKLALLSTLPFSARDTRTGFRKRMQRVREYARKALSPHNWIRLLQGQINLGGVSKTIREAGAESGKERKLKDSTQDIMQGFASSRQPCLFVHGDNDPEASAARRYYQDFCSAHSVPARFLEIENAGHDYLSVPSSTAAENAAVEFLHA